MFSKVQRCIDRYIEKEDALTVRVMRNLLEACEGKGVGLCEAVGRKLGSGDDLELDEGLLFLKGFDFLMQRCPKQPLLYHVLHYTALKANGETVRDVDKAWRDKIAAFRRQGVSKTMIFFLETELLKACDWRIYRDYERDFDCDKDLEKI